jgi:hypothetical protein
MNLLKSIFISMSGKAVSLQPRGRLGGEKVQVLLILVLGSRWGWVVSVTPRPHFSPGERTPPVPIVQEARLAPEPVWIQIRGKILLPLPGIEPRSPGRPARNQKLDSLSYPADISVWYYNEISIL